MLNVLQVMSRAGDSTAKIGQLLSRELTEISFRNCYLQGAAPAGELSMSYPGFMISGLLRYLAALLMYKVLRNYKPDVIVAHRFKCLHISGMLAFLFGCPLVLVVHGIGDYDRAYRRRLLNKMLAKGLHVVCVSEYVRDYVRSVAGDDYLAKLHVIENSIRYEEVFSRLFSREAARENLGAADNEEMVIGYVGRLVNVKGVRDFVSAACKIQERNIRFVVVGDGLLRTELEELAAGADSLASISFMGFVPDAVRLFRGFDLLVLPSRSEGFPIALLEAMAAEVPVLVSDIAVYREILRSADCFFKVGDVADLVSQIKKFVAEFELGELMELGRVRAGQVKADYPYENFVDGYAELFKEMAT